MDGNFKTRRDFVSRLFYNHGFFCASHPALVIIFAATIAFICSWPVLKSPLVFIGAVQEFPTSVDGFHVPPKRDRSSPVAGQPRWFSGHPQSFIQQFVVKSTISPWNESETIPADAFRAPVSKAFYLEDLLTKFHYEGKNLRNFCHYVVEVEKRGKGIFPEHKCLMISPGNVWHGSLKEFLDDPNVVQTIYQLEGNSLEPPPSVKEILFGVPWQKTGIHRYYVRNRQRILSYAVTVLIQNYDSRFLEALKEYLKSQLPPNAIDTASNDNIVHLYFKDDASFVEIAPLAFMYIILLLYIYFSVSKLEEVKSKWGLAFSAVAMVLSSLCMSFGLCITFGLTPTLNGGEIFPYLVVIIGLENIWVLTKSIVSRRQQPDIKKRVAEGLSLEAWSITKNLTTELVITLLGYFTYVIAIQEFCMFAMVGLLTDAFLQMFFFVSVLAIDSRRYDQLPQYMIGSKTDTPYPSNGTTKMRRSRSVPRGIDLNIENSYDNMAVPRRLKFIFAWAEMRFIQRAIMVCVFTWILLTSFLVYKTGVVEHLTTPASPLADQGLTFAGLKLTPAPPQLWKQLHYLHWPSLFDFYNIKLNGKYISILPPISMTLNVDLEEVRSLRNPVEMEKFKQKQLDPNSLGPDSYSWDDVVTVALALSSGSLFVILLAFIYKCVSCRNHGKYCQKEGSKPLEPLSTPLQLKGHSQEVECLSCSSGLVASSSLDGEIRVWDPLSGECLRQLNRVGKYAEPLPPVNHIPQPAAAAAPSHRSRFPGAPDFSSTISTDFNSQQSPSPSPSPSHSDTTTTGYDFLAHFQQHTLQNPESPKDPTPSPTPSPSPRWSSVSPRWSVSPHSLSPRDPTEYQVPQALLPTEPPAAVWCLACHNDLVVAGCANGSLEVWNGVNGVLLDSYNEENVGITSVCLSDSRLVLARLDGRLEFLKLVHLLFKNLPTVGRPPTGQGHGRNLSFTGFDAQLTCRLQHSERAHQQPITELKMQSSQLFTGSQDHTIKVYRLDDCSCQYTLYGHAQGITALHTQQEKRSLLLSGSADGLVILWNTLTGLSSHQFKGHSGAVTSLTSSGESIISSGADSRLLVWDRETGHLIHSLELEIGYRSSFVALSNQYMVSGGQGCLIVWDLYQGQPVARVQLGRSENSVRQIQMIDSSMVACDLGEELRVIHFPVDTHKQD